MHCPRRTLSASSSISSSSCSKIAVDKNAAGNLWSHEVVHEPNRRSPVPIKNLGRWTNAGAETRRPNWLRALFVGGRISVELGEEHGFPSCHVCRTPSVEWRDCGETFAATYKRKLRAWSLVVAGWVCLTEPKIKTELTGDLSVQRDCILDELDGSAFFATDQSSSTLTLHPSILSLPFTHANHCFAVHIWRWWDDVWVLAWRWCG